MLQTADCVLCRVRTRGNTDQNYRARQITGRPGAIGCKRGDIGSTAEMYATELFERFGADAVTINSADAMQPFELQEKGLYPLQNIQSRRRDLQNLELANGQLVYEHVAKLAIERGTTIEASVWL